MRRAWRALLAAALLSLGLGVAAEERERLAAPEVAPVLSFFAAPGRFNFLTEGAGWRDALLVHLDAAEPPDPLLEFMDRHSVYSATIHKDDVQRVMQQMLGGKGPMSPEPDCPRCREELRCQLNFLGLVAEFMRETTSKQLCRQNISLHPSGTSTSPCHALAAGLLHILIELSRHRPAHALLATARLAAELGWDWRGTHHTALGHGQEACWDQMALLRGLLAASADTDESLSFRLNLGSLADEWQQHLDGFFHQSLEHAVPWAVDGNLEPLTQAPSGRLSAAVQWALPKTLFEVSEYLAKAENPAQEQVESRAFLAAGYAWHLGLVALRKDALFGVRLWLPPLPPFGARASGACGDWTGAPILFNVSLAVVHSSGGSDWTESWQCSWPDAFTDQLVCYALRRMPLWDMLTGALPGYMEHDELLLRASVAMLSSCGAKEASASAAGVADDCLRRDEAAMGPLTGFGGMLSTPLLRWGFLRSHPGLRGVHGFESRRLRGSGAVGVGRQLANAAAKRLAVTPWLDAALYTDVAGRQAQERAAQRSEGAAVGGSRSAVPAAPDQAGTSGDEAFEELCMADVDVQPTGSHLASALAAGALLLMPFAGWQVARVWSSRLERRRANARQPQHTPHIAACRSQHPKRAQRGKRAAECAASGRSGNMTAAPLRPADSPSSSSQRAESSVEPSRSQNQAASLRKTGDHSGRAQPANNTATGQPSQSELVKDQRATVLALQGVPGCSAAGARQSATLLSGSIVGAATHHALTASKSTTSGIPKEQAAARPAWPPGPQDGPQLPAAGERLDAMMPSQHAATPTDISALVDLLLGGPQLPPEDLPLEGSRSAAELSGAKPDAHAPAWHPSSGTPPRGPQQPATPASSAPAPAGPSPQTLSEGIPETQARSAAAAAKDSAQEAAAAAEAECVVCWEAPRQVVLVPCGHVALCRCCADQLLATPDPQCPVCRRQASFAQAFFVA